MGLRLKSRSSGAPPGPTCPPTRPPLLNPVSRTPLPRLRPRFLGRVSPLRDNPSGMDIATFLAHLLRKQGHPRFIVERTVATRSTRWNRQLARLSRYPVRKWCHGKQWYAIYHAVRTLLRSISPAHCLRNGANPVDTGGHPPLLPTMRYSASIRARNVPAAKRMKFRRTLLFRERRVATIALACSINA